MPQSGNSFITRQAESSTEKRNILNLRNSKWIFFSFFNVFLMFLEKREVMFSFRNRISAKVGREAPT